MTTRKELIEALRLRYRSAGFSDRIRILDEFVALTSYHRKHAVRVLRGEFSPATEVRLRNRVYGEAVAQALTVLWEAADRVCGKRLKALIPILVDAMERHRHLDLDAVIKTKVLRASAATASSGFWPLHGRTSTDSASGARARARQSAGASRCATSPTGSIRRQASSRSTWSSTQAAPRRMVTTSTRSR